MNIYVGNLSRTVTEEMIRAEFEKFGKVDSIKIITDKFTGEPRGFCFIEMPDKEHAEAAMEALNGADLDGRTLRVNEARSQEDRPRGPRGPRSGGGGGFRRNDNRGGGRRF